MRRRTKVLLHPMMFEIAIICATVGLMLPAMKKVHIKRRFD